MRTLLMVLVLFASSLVAADVSGTWKGKVETPNGTAERTFVFKVNGDKLTGETVSTLMGKSPIMNGTVNGDTLRFQIKLQLDGNEMQADYKGKVMGDEIAMTVEVAGQTLEYKVKKVQ